jgi:hypothetical protein
MTEQEFKALCSEIPCGTTLTFSYRDKQVRGKFVGCTADAVIIEANGQNFIWPRDLCEYRKSSYPIPSYS